MTSKSASSATRVCAPRPLWAMCALAALGGCAQPPASRQVAQRSSEYFPSAVYGPASPRVVADGQPVPRGGGQYLVGHPYTVAGRRYFPSEQGHQPQVGMASYYGAAFHGRKTANGEVFDMASISAAHPTMPLPSYARVTNLTNGRSIIVRVNDRGPYHGGRVMDLSQRAAELLDYRRSGTAHVRVEYAGRAPLAGSDDRMLLASLRTDGQPATINGAPAAAPVMVASAEPMAPVRREAPREAAVVAIPRQARSEDVVVAEQPLSSGRTILVANAPLPPSRPFDLGTIPGAGEPIAAISAPRRAAAMFFAPVADAPGRFTRRGPFSSDGGIDTRAR